MGIFQNNLMGAAAAAASAGGADFYDHQIVNSVRLGDSGYLKRTPSGAGNRATWTFSTWIKITKLGTSTNSDQPGGILNAGSGSGNQDTFYRLNYSQTKLFSSSGAANFFFSNSLYRDTSAWYHVVWKHGSGTSTVYVNGVAASGATASVSGNTAINNSVQHVIGGSSNTLGETPLKAYLAETIMIDGTALDPDSFGETKNGVWIPKDPSGLTFGTNGFYLKYESSSDLGNDSSGNNNDWTPVNLSAHDQMLDTPTFNSDSNGGNFSTLLAIQEGTSGSTVNGQLSEGNLKFLGANLNAGQPIFNSMMVSSGKWYVEFLCQTYGGANPTIGIGAPYYNSSWNSSYSSGYYGSSVAQIALGWDGAGDIHVAGSLGIGGQSYSSGDILSIAGDLDGNAVYAWKNGTAINSGNAIGSSPFISGQFYTFGCQTYSNGVWIANFGQDGTFAGNVTAGGNSDDTGYGNFKYDVPAGFLSLCTGNLPVEDAIDPAQTSSNYPQKLFSATTYSGNGSASARNIDTGIASDFVWIKRRNADSTDHMLYDSSRGVGKYLRSNQSNAEDTSGTSLSAFNSDGFQLSDNGTFLNASGGTYISYNWRANGGSASNSDGATSSTVQADPSGAFSIVTYTGFAGASGTSTVGHGMGVAPNMIIHKSRSRESAWWVAVPGVLSSQSHFLQLNATNTPLDLSSYGTISAPTSSVFTINGVDGIGGESATYVAYCFANVEGYCQVGTYVGNGNDDGTFAYTGFRPAVILIREYGAVDNWLLYNNKTLGYNLDSAGNAQVYPDTNVDEEAQASRAIDILSNGFKLRTSNATGNASSGNYLYLALAHNPFKYATAR